MFSGRILTHWPHQLVIWLLQFGFTGNTLVEPVNGHLIPSNYYWCRKIFKIHVYDSFHFNAISDKYTLNCILIYRMYCFRMHKLLYVINCVIDVCKYLTPSNHKMCYIINLDLHTGIVVNRIHMIITCI